MPRRSNFFGAALVAISLAFCAACASTPEHEATGEYFDDGVITTKVKFAILNESTLKVLDIEVVTTRGEVALGGTVPTKDAADKAVALARAVEGVKSVKNNLQVK
jgi:hyperosmotically inducible protein